jgi:8-oxo-dGTP pyrophosphatase MutT (NUDIX family)
MGEKQLTLCIIVEEGKILLGYKKRGFGAGLWNGFGGKVHEGETTEEATVRELHEEAVVSVEKLAHAGELNFLYPAHPEEKFCVTLYRGEGIQGEPQETEEMRPQWFLQSGIPYDVMWDDDKFWLPVFLEGKYIQGTFWFDSENKVTKHEMIVGENV